MAKRGPMSVADRIEQKLRAAFKPTALTVIDESHLHAGHMGARPEGETHFRVEMVAEAFEVQNRVARQRAVNATLKEELDGPVHALAMKLSAPGE